MDIQGRIARWFAPVVLAVATASSDAPLVAGGKPVPIVPGAHSVSASRAVRLLVNGQPCTIDVDGHATLLHLLRNDCALNGPKYGCGLGQCGACTVLVDGVAARACVIPAAGVDGRSIVTLEGLAIDGDPHPVQQAFIDAQAAQCGYCLNGMIMATVALLADTPKPTGADVARALSHNLCRCGTHVEIAMAVLRAADLVAEANA